MIQADRESKSRNLRTLLTLLQFYTNSTSQRGDEETREELLQKLFGCKRASTGKSLLFSPTGEQKSTDGQPVETSHNGQALKSLRHNKCTARLLKPATLSANITIPGLTSLLLVSKFNGETL